MKKNEKNVGIEQLRKLKEETTERWRKLGLLEGLNGLCKGNVAELFQSELSYIIPEDNINENIKTMDTYFIPEISDLRVGYECEVQEIVSAISHCVDDIIRTDLTYDENWVKVSIDYPVYLKLHHYLELLESGHLRTSYLTKEEIEAEGWEETVSHGVFGKKESKVGYLQCVGEPPLIWIAINNQEKYHGECKSVNEFRFTCKLLKIK